MLTRLIYKQRQINFSWDWTQIDCSYPYNDQCCGVILEINRELACLVEIRKHRVYLRVWIHALESLHVSTCIGVDLALRYVACEIKNFSSLAGTQSVVNSLIMGGANIVVSTIDCKVNFDRKGHIIHWIVLLVSQYIDSLTGAYDCQIVGVYIKLQSSIVKWNFWWIELIAWRICHYIC